jgi:hypothetical protein
MFQVRLEMLDECVEPLVWVRERERRLHQAAMEALSLVSDERIEQLILCGKVTIKSAPRYAGSFAYRENGHTMYARSKDHIFRRRQNRGDGRLGPAATPASPCRTDCRRWRRRGSALTRLASDRRRLTRLHWGLGFGSLLD